MRHGVVMRRLGLLHNDCLFSMHCTLSFWGLRLGGPR